MLQIARSVMLQLTIENTFKLLPAAIEFEDQASYCI
jgi:hypothetical protein